MKIEHTNSGRHHDDTASAVAGPSWREELRLSRVFSEKLRELLKNPDIADLVVPPNGEHREAALRALAEVPPDALATVLPDLRGTASSDQRSIAASEELESDGGPTKKSRCRPAVMLRALKLLEDPKINGDFCSPVESLLETVQARIDPALRGFLVLPHDPEEQPDTTTWADLYRDLSVKTAWTDLSSQEFAAYEALSRLWRKTDVFSAVPRVVQLSAHLMSLTQSSTGDDPFTPKFDEKLRKEMRVYLLAPRDQMTREQLRRNDMITGDPDDISVHRGDVPLKDGELIEWPQIKDGGKVQTCLQARAVIMLYSLALDCYRRGYTTYLLTQADRNKHLDRKNLCHVECRYVSEATREECTSANLGTGREKTHSESSRRESLKALQRVVVTRFLEASDKEFRWQLSPEDFQSLHLEASTTENYTSTLRRVPWFRKILDTCTTPPLENPSPVPPPSHSPAPSPELTAHGCRYRDEFFDSREEAAVAIILERYISSFWIKRGESFQILVESKKIDFFIGNDSDSEVYLEYHPIIFGDLNNLYDFKSRDEFFDYSIEKLNGYPKTDTKWREKLATRYAAERLALAQIKSTNARLIHVQDTNGLRGELETFLKKEIPEQPFNEHFAGVYEALGKLQKAEELLNQELDRGYAKLYRREWNLAQGDQISRPVRSQTWAPPVLTSFAHRSLRRAIEIVVPELFGTLTKHGRADDEFYTSQDTLVETLKRAEYETLCIPAHDVTEESARAIARQVVAFLTKEEELALDEEKSSKGWEFPFTCRPSLESFPFAPPPWSPTFR
jgi:hypothetical protein